MAWSCAVRYRVLYRVLYLVCSYKLRSLHLQGPVGVGWTQAVLAPALKSLGNSCLGFLPPPFFCMAMASWTPDSDSDSKLAGARVSDFPGVDPEIRISGLQIRISGPGIRFSGLHPDLRPGKGRKSGFPMPSSCSVQGTIKDWVISDHR